MSGLLARWAPHAFLAALCAGLATANVGRATVFAILLAGLVVTAGAAVARGATLHVLVCGALLLVGWWWASARLDAIDRSVLAPEIGQAGRFVLAITGPGRRSKFSLRIPAEARRFGRRELREEDIRGLIRAEIDDRHGAAAQFVAAGHTDRAAVLHAEADVLAALLDEV